MFNTLQILMALPLLAVMMPANVEAIAEVVTNIVNFTIVEKETLYDATLGPVFGTEDDPDKDVGLVGQVLTILLVVFIFGLLIGVIVLCKIKCLPRCCNCFKKSVNFAQGKLMFNSILRALMQTYLINSIAMWRSFSETNFDSSEKIVDFVLAILFLVAYIAFPIYSCKFLRKNQE